MITARSSYSSFSVDSIDKAKEFYVDTLALTPIETAQGLMLELPGGGTLFIYEKADHKAADFTVLNFVVDDINEAVDHLAGHHGIVFEHYEGMPAPQDERGILRGKASNDGPDIAWFKDPAGNVLSVIEE